MAGLTYKVPVEHADWLGQPAQAYFLPACYELTPGHY